MCPEGIVQRFRSHLTVQRAEGLAEDRHTSPLAVLIDDPVHRLVDDGHRLELTRARGRRGALTPTFRHAPRQPTCAARGDSWPLRGRQERLVEAVPLPCDSCQGHFDRSTGTSDTSRIDLLVLVQRFLLGAPRRSNGAAEP